MSISKVSSFFQFSRFSKYSAIALLILRIVVGLAFILHGWQKIQHPFSWMPETSGVPSIFQFLAAVSEFFGGIAWILGLLTRLASLGIASTMAVAVYFHLILKGDPFVNLSGGHSYELALVYLCISILFLTMGAGNMSIDNKLFRKN